MSPARFSTRSTLASNHCLPSACIQRTQSTTQSATEPLQLECALLPVLVTDACYSDIVGVDELSEFESLSLVVGINLSGRLALALALGALALASRSLRGRRGSS